MANSGRVEINSSSIRDDIRKNPNSQDFWNFWCMRSVVYQALLSTHERKPGFVARLLINKLVHVAKNTRPSHSWHSENIS